MIFQLVEGGRCLLCQKPATARNHPTQNEGYQACISNAKAMEGRPSRPAFPARRSVPRVPFPRVEPWLVRTLPFRAPFRALLLPSKPVHVRCSLTPHPCPCPAPLLSIVAPLLSHLLDVLLSRSLSPCLSLATSPRASLSLSLPMPRCRRDTSSLSAK